MMEQGQLGQLFSCFEKELITDLIEMGEVRRWSKGSVLMERGQTIRSAVLITGGLAKVFRQDVQGGQFFVYHLRAGQGYALSLPGSNQQEASPIVVRAATKVEVIVIPFHLTERWMREYRGWNAFVLRSYQSAIDELLAAVDRAAFAGLDERVLLYLKSHQEMLKTNHLHISITEIASDLNSSREVLSRLLKKLSDRRVIRVKRNHLEILDPNLVAS